MVCTRSCSRRKKSKIRVYKSILCSFVCFQFPLGQHRLGKINEYAFVHSLFDFTQLWRLSLKIFLYSYKFCGDLKESILFKGWISFLVCRTNCKCPFSVFLVLDIIIAMVAGCYLHVLKQMVSTDHKLVGTLSIMAISTIRKGGSGCLQILCVSPSHPYYSYSVKYQENNNSQQKGPCWES